MSTRLLTRLNLKIVPLLYSHRGASWETKQRDVLNPRRFSGIADLRHDCSCILIKDDLKWCISTCFVLIKRTGSVLKGFHFHFLWHELIARNSKAILIQPSYHRLISRSLTQSRREYLHLHRPVCGHQPIVPIESPWRNENNINPWHPPNIYSTNSECLYGTMTRPAVRSQFRGRRQGILIPTKKLHSCARVENGQTRESSGDMKIELINAYKGKREKWRLCLRLALIWRD